MINDARVLTFASFLLDISLLKADFVQFKTSHVTLSALAIALEREQRIAGKNFAKESEYLYEVMQMENFDEETYLQCKRLLNHHRELAKTDFES